MHIVGLISYYNPSMCFDCMSLLCWLEDSIACWVEAIKDVPKEVMQKEHNLNGRLFGTAYNEVQYSSWRC